MPSILLSGPASGGKSQEAKRLLSQATEPTIQADFQSIVVALLGLERGPDGKFPIRPDWILPLAEYVRLSALSGAVTRQLTVVATNSDGDPARRAALLDRLGPGATERLVDPGEAVVRARLADVDGVLDPECERAISRWYTRLSR